MTAKLTSLTPSRVAERLKGGHAVLIDIRERDEFARRRIAGALSRPLSGWPAGRLPTNPQMDVIFTCRSGMRTAAHAARLGGAVDAPAFVLEGGVDGWAAAGLPVEGDAKAPLELMRQVQIAAGALVVSGVALGALVHPGFLALAAFVGVGLVVAGATGFCGMARLLARAPWNAALRG